MVLVVVGKSIFEIQYFSKKSVSIGFLVDKQI